jgi:hypothetical protein
MNALQTHMIVLAAIALTAAGCGSGTGSVDVSSPKGLGSRSALGCTEKCHNSSNTGSPDPLVTNGTGTTGKHIRHVQERSIACERCHSGYANSPTHMNGTVDTRSHTVNVVTMDIVGPKGTWEPGTGQCSGVACHGTSTMDWYGTTTWTTPACTVCHSSAFSSVLDPVVTGGSGTTGKHEKHVTIYNYACSKCHLNYSMITSHANGAWDAQDPASQIVWFDETNPTGTWGNDTGAGTGVCSALSCHGLYSGTFTFDFAGDGNLTTVSYAGAGVTTPSWYSTGLGCSACHGNPPSAYSAWHGSHANNTFSGPNDCQLCHPNAIGSGGIGTAITDTTLHVNLAVNVQPSWKSLCFRCHQ